MDNEKYSNYPLSISAILGLIEANDIAIPEIQRPFVWKKTQVRGFNSYDTFLDKRRKMMTAKIKKYYYSL